MERWCWILIGLVLIGISSCDSPTEPKQNPCEQQPIEWPSLAKSPWPMTYGNPQRTCQGLYKSQGINTIIWDKELRDGIYAGIVVDEKDNVYFGTHQWLGEFYKLNANGELAPILSTDKRNSCAPLIDRKNRVYFGSLDGNLYEIDTSGALLWKYNAGVYFEGTKCININKNFDILFTSND